MKTTVLKKNVTQSFDELCAKRGEALNRIIEIWSEIEGEDREAPEALNRIVEIWSEIDAEDREALDRAVTIFSLLLSRRG